MSAEIGVRISDGRIVAVREQTVFTTTVDRQLAATFEIHIRGPGTAGWTPLQTVSLEPLPPAPAGQPDLKLRVLRSASGSLTLEITDSFSGQAQTLPLAAAAVGPSRRRSAAPLWAAAGLAAALAVAAGAWWLAGLGAPGRSGPATKAAPAASRAVKPVATRAQAQAQEPLPQRQAAPAAQAPPPQQAAPQPPQPQERAQQQPPQPQPVAAPQPQDSEYQVVWGDTLWQIAERFYGDRSLYRDLAAKNELPDADLIIAGETLRIPGKVEK